MLLVSVVEAVPYEVAKAEQRLVVVLANQIHDLRPVHSKGQQAFDHAADDDPVGLAVGQEALDPALVANELPRSSQLEKALNLWPAILDQRLRPTFRIVGSEVPKDANEFIDVAGHVALCCRV